MSERIRVGLISDLHANHVALTAVLDDLRREGVDEIVCLGDVATMGPEPLAVLDTLRDIGCPCIVGNHEDFILEPSTLESYTEAPQVLDAVSWCRDEMRRDDLDFLATFVPRMEISLGGESQLLLFHGCPTSNRHDLLPTTPPEELDAHLEGFAAEVMACGHTHIQMLRQHHGTLLVNPGSVGSPFLEHVEGRPPTILAHAEYAIVEAQDAGRSVHVDLRRVALDREALREAVTASKNPLRNFLLAQYA